MTIAAWTTVFFCSGCSAEQPFEQPQCADGHGVDCPDWACSVCGYALVTGFPLVWSDRARAGAADCSSAA
jgi:hypothetical protein